MFLSISKAVPLSSVLLMLLAACVLATQFATRRPLIILTTPTTSTRRRSAELFMVRARDDMAMAMSRQTGPLVKPPGRFSRRFRRDPLSKYRAVTGVRARIRWWERGRSLLGLGFMVVLLGVALAIILLLLALGLRVGLELIIE